MLTPVGKISAAGVIIRAIHGTDQEQLDAVAELDRRGLWLTGYQKRQAGLCDLVAARREYFRLYCEDVRAHPECFKASVRDDPRAAAASVIDGLNLAETKTMLRDLREEIRTVRDATG
jgi:hypothetical protein